MMAAVVAASASLSACAPNDEKVSNRNFSGNASGDSVDATFTDHVKEYSRAMLIELGDVARQTETVLQAVPVASVNPVTPATIAPPTAVKVSALRASACRVVTSVPSPSGTLQFNSEATDCKEKGATFEGTQNGREVSFVSLGVAADQSPLALVVRVEGKGIETTLVPVKNPKDTLRVKTSRFLEATYVGENAGLRTYKFSFESHSSYNLDLKTLFDNGQITSTVQGTFDYSVADKKITMFRALVPTDRMQLKVQSGRQSKNGGKVARQLFFGSADAGQLAIDLEACSLPTGEMKSRFTVAPLGAGGKYNVDSTLEIQALKDSIVDKAKLGLPRSATTAKLCSADQQITMTEFYAGLIY